MEHAFKGKDVDGHYNRRAPIGSRVAKSTRLWDKVDMDIETILADVAAAVEPHRGAGKVASYIPALAEVDPRKFGIAIVDGQGKCHGAGDCDEPFSIQSISKVFTFGQIGRASCRERVCQYV